MLVSLARDFSQDESIIQRGDAARPRSFEYLTAPSLRITLRLKGRPGPVQNRFKLRDSRFIWLDARRN